MRYSVQTLGWDLWKEHGSFVKQGRKLQRGMAHRERGPIGLPDVARAKYVLQAPWMQGLRVVFAFIAIKSD